MSRLKAITTPLGYALHSLADAAPAPIGNVLNSLINDAFGKDQEMTAAKAPAKKPAAKTSARRTKAAPKIMTLRPGPVATNRIHVKNTRDQAFGGCAVIIGTGRHARARMHATTGISVCLPNTTDAIDPVKLAKELGADMCAVNKGRIWTIDEAEVLGGYRVDFHGVKMGWVGEMIVKDLMDQFHNAYLPCLIQRYSNWIFHAGKEVHILRDPEGTTWVMQEYTKAVDRTLTINNLKNVGKKLKKLPKGWTFETKVLTEELSLDTMRSDGWASIMRDELGCTYQACGYGGDTSANYIP
jgi:hypothetical protein